MTGSEHIGQVLLNTSKTRPKTVLSLAKRDCAHLSAQWYPFAGECFFQNQNPTGPLNAVTKANLPFISATTEREVLARVDIISYLSEKYE